FLQLGELGAEDQVLDLHLAARLLVAALDDDAGRVALVGIFHLWTELAGAKIELGADPGAAQARHHALVVGEAILVEDGDDHRAARGLGVELADQRKRSLQARYANGEARRRHRLAAETRHEPVVAPTATHRAEAHRASFFVFRLEQELNLE